MDPIEIQYRLRKKGLRQQDFVRKGRSAQLISQVVYRITKSRPVEEDLAEALGHPACAKDASTPTGHPNTPRPGRSISRLPQKIGPRGPPVHGRIPVCSSPRVQP